MSIVGPWKVVDELIEQPSWGGRYIIDLKGLSDDPAWVGKKVGQSYELAGSSALINPDSKELRSFTELIADDPLAWLGADVLAKFGSKISLLIKLTQAKGNSFQVHLPEGKTLKHWLPKPEAWFYLAPGLFTFGLKAGKSYDAYANVLRTIDDHLHRLSDEVTVGKRSVEDARQQAAARIAALDPLAYVNTVHAKTDDIVDLTAGGIHHSWEEDNVTYPDGNLVYEVQVDVQDVDCSMRGFDKGKILDNGNLRPSHVDDYLATIEQDSFHNDLSHHIRQPQLLSSQDGATIEALFRTPYFNLDRITLTPESNLNHTTAHGFRHFFVFHGDADVAGITVVQGQSYIVPASTGDFSVTAGKKGTVILDTFLPI